MKKAKGLLWVLGAAALATLFAIGLPRLAKHLPWQTERWLGDAVGAPAASLRCSSGESGAPAVAFDRLVRRLYPLYPDDALLPISFDVLHGRVVNAFATLGGHIHVIDGLIQKARSPEELAGVLAHEIEHVRNRHIAQGVVADLLTLGALDVAVPEHDMEGSRAAYLLLHLKFSRQQEEEADEKGLARLKAAHVDSSGFEQFFSRAEASGEPIPLLSSHPGSESRAALAVKFRGYPVEPVLEPAEWHALRAICQ